MLPPDPGLSTGSRTFPASPQFVELVETNPDVTPAFTPYPRPLTARILLYVIPFRLAFPLFFPSSNLFSQRGEGIEEDAVNTITN